MTWEYMIGILSFPLTNPTAMLTLAAQVCHKHIMYIYLQKNDSNISVKQLYLYIFDSFLKLIIHYRHELSLLVWPLDGPSG